MTSSARTTDRKSTRLNSSHLVISYAVFCLKKKNNTGIPTAVAEEYTRFHAMALASSFGEQADPQLLAVVESRVRRMAQIMRFFFFLMIRRPPRSTLFPYPALFR